MMCWVVKLRMMKGVTLVQFFVLTMSGECKSNSM